MNTDYDFDVNKEVQTFIEKSLSTDVKAAHTALKILLLKSLPNVDSEDTESDE